MVRNIILGVVITNENVYLADKEKSSNRTAKLVEFLGVDGVIISQEGFGNPDTDLVMNSKKITDKGIKTVIVTDEYAGSDGASNHLLIWIFRVMQLLQVEMQMRSLYFRKWTK